VDNGANIDLDDPPALLVMAADVSPDEVLMHMQALGEDHNVPSIFVSSRYVLGRISSTKSATAVVLVQKERRAKIEGKAAVPGYAGRYATVANLIVRLDKQLHFKQPGFVSKWPAPIPHPSWISTEVNDIQDDQTFKALMERETLKQAQLDVRDFDEATKLEAS
jgi:Ribosomal protein L7Ae/L30e/S12e/Gadd45 family